MNSIHTKDNLQQYLQKYFDYDTFHEGQEEIITDIMKGSNVLGILRTGTGKSLCYQLPAKILTGLTIVVSPLISLMIDQVRELRARQYKDVVALHSFQRRDERQIILSKLHTYKLIYVSPELLQNEYVMNRFQGLTISLFVIDEAHCISQWGYDFRPDYLRLPEVISSFSHPPVLALTGTATPEVQKDIQHKLKLQEMVKHIYPMDRENISLIIEEIDSGKEAKQQRLLEWIATNKTSTIVYFSSRLLSEKISTYLSEHLPDRSIAFYHGGLDTIDRLKIQQQFMNNQLDVICCTSAFGMGINKPDIRMIIHYHFPTRLESYIQEIGRAGRDGRDSVSVLLYQSGDIHIPLQIIENELPSNSELKFTQQRLIEYKRNQLAIPKDDLKIEQQFGMAATKWRYVLFHLEKSQLVNQHRITSSEVELNSAFQHLQRFTEKRIATKRHYLNEVLSWIYATGCLRQALYRSFQQKITQKSVNCCSNCGFNLESWQVIEQETQPFTKTNWQSILKSVLLIGDKH